MLKIGGAFQSFESFKEWIKDYLKFKEVELQVRVVRTDIQNEGNAIKEFLKGGNFKIEKEYGCIKHITKVIKYLGRRQTVNILLYFDEVYRTFILFTDEGISKMDIVLSFVEKNRHFHEIWLPPSSFEEFSEDLLDLEVGEIIYFKAKRDKNIFCERRPEIDERVIEYYGKDGNITLREEKIDYGVLPVKLEFYFPSQGVFRVYREGKFVFRKGNFDFFMKEIVYGFILNAIKIDNVFEQTILEVEMEDGLLRYNIKTAEIKLSVRIDSQKFVDLYSLMEKNNFDVYNVTLLDDEVFMSGYIVDKDKNEVFSLTSRGDSFSLLPKYGAKYHSLLRFYKFIVDNIDRNAKPFETPAKQ